MKLSSCSGSFGTDLRPSAFEENDIEALRNGGRKAIGAHTFGLIAAIDAGDEIAVKDYLSVAARAHRLNPVLSAITEGRCPQQALIMAWATPNTRLSGAAARLPVELTSEVLAKIVGEGDIKGTAVMIGCLAGSAVPALLANDAFALRVSATHPAVLAMLFDVLPKGVRPEAVASERGEIVTQLIERDDADDLLERLLESVVASQREDIARRLLRETRHLLATAARGQRIPSVLDKLLRLTGDEMRQVIEEAWDRIRLAQSPRFPMPKP